MIVSAFVPLWLIVGFACGLWAGFVGARNVAPGDRNAVISGGIIVGLFIGILAVPLFYWTSPKPSGQRPHHRC